VGQVRGFVQNTEHSDSALDGEKPRPVIIHGTVNIVLANKNGIVAVTDSRLSSNGQPVDVGQKLFRIDDHTICTMAGAYRVPGPTKDGVHYPAEMVISNLISQFSIRESKGDDSPELKLARLTGLVALRLSFLDAMNESQGIETGKYQTILTFAAYHTGKFQIWQTSIQPVHSPSKGSVRYLHTLPEYTVVPDALFYALAGVTDVAVSHLTLLQSGKPDHAIPNSLRRQIAINQGRDLSLHSLLILANLLEKGTAAKYGNVVGDAVQAAQIGKSGITKSLAPLKFPPPVPPPSNKVVWFEYNQIRLADADMQALRDSGGYGSIRSGMDAIPKVLAVALLGGNISGLVQGLDGFYFHQTRFERCQLIYNGSPTFLFDQSNTVIDSILKLGPGVAKNNPNVVQILRDFPQLKLIEADR
jgi:hypothetical protein